MIALKRAAISSSASSQVISSNNAQPLRPDAAARRQNARLVVGARQVVVHLYAEEPLRHRMPRVALDLDRDAILHGHLEGAGIRAVVRADPMHDFYLLGYRRHYHHSPPTNPFEPQRHRGHREGKRRVRKSFCVSPCSLCALCASVVKRVAIPDDVCCRGEYSASGAGIGVRALRLATTTIRRRIKGEVRWQ